ncbi:hypothetical protein LIER_44078 [Lithospermum erythrorhizon]|uniref:Uncharacterized protein n=1 Tax=Lithospermum erythrorhizon TaxID=34254 RepID=A0AAV3P5W5_LITER
MMSKGGKHGRKVSGGSPVTLKNICVLTKAEVSGLQNQVVETSENFRPIEVVNNTDFSEKIFSNDFWFAPHENIVGWNLPTIYDMYDEDYIYHQHVEQSTSDLSYDILWFKVIQKVLACTRQVMIVIWRHHTKDGDTYNYHGVSYADLDSVGKRTRFLDWNAV